MIYYNEFDRDAADWLEALIAQGSLPAGHVDRRSIKDVQPDDLEGYASCHFFAGIGGWPLAARLAGWPDERPLWTGSCPCQPFSVAGKGGGIDDARHLWPDFFRLIRARRPSVVMGEQVAGKAGYGWFDRVRADLAREDYASRGVDIPACAVDAPHIRQRLYWVAVADASRLGQREQELDASALSRSDARLDLGGSRREHGGAMADTDHSRRGRRPSIAERVAVARTASEGHHEGGGEAVEHAARLGRGEGRPESEFRSGRPALAGADVQGNLADNNNNTGLEGHGQRLLRAQGRNVTSGPDAHADAGFWSEHDWINCHDRKTRRTQPGLPLLAHGVPRRVAKWRGFGNAIVPPLAAQVIAAFMDAEDD